ncbi:TMAO reductase system sensor histidine kinase/response regulator TorS [Vibrio sp. MACH09]|uniref:TMAO reductase system sensor histidine kinase/response regulator TorS n=1 Tax=Vibrio sp. MACH09 TaxID=3025122 RepID=UPI00295ED535|nr:TMAO reductase system sensor histidine kinase/response regulator TorS [Vibrio sp. MACH09]
MLLASASIGRKLLLSFASMAGLLILAVAIGTSGFSFVAQTERKVVDSAMPAMIQAREVSEHSTRILSSVRYLADVKTETGRQQVGRQMVSELELLLNNIKELGDKPFDIDVLDTLEERVQSVIDTIADLGVVVEKKLNFERQISIQVDEMRIFADELETLTRTQVSNTSTIAVANVTHIYDLVDKGNKEQVYTALDNLIEVDLDLSERLHELHLLAFRMLTQIEESKTVTDFDRILQLSSEFNSNLNIMKRRILSVEDPTRSEQMKELVDKLVIRQRVFDLLEQRYKNAQNVERLKEQSLTQFSELNQTVNLLVDESNADTASAVEDVNQTLIYAKWSLVVLSLLGLISVSFILWNVVYLSVIKKLHEYSDAIRSVARGELDFSLKIKGKDELAEMGRAIVTARDTAEQLQIVAKSEAVAKLELEQHKEHLEETVTERTKQLRNANDRLNQEVQKHALARSEAEQANRAKTAFLSTMSHEIRTPMNGVLGTATLLKSTSLNSKQSYYVDVINRSGSALLAILNDVLDYSKIEAGRLEIRQEVFSLSDVVTDIYQLMESRAIEKGLGFYKHIESDLAGSWIGDPNRISQVLNNLVGNAIKFTSTGEVELYVSLDPQDPQRVIFEITDSGIGINEEEQKLLFDAFSQVGSEKAKLGGTGLGLAISKKIVIAMRGDINVDSEPGQGSRFWFSIPLDKTSETISKPSTKSKATNRLKAKVFMVEDNPVNCLVAEGFLSNAGHNTVIAEDGAHAEQLFKQQPFDIALLDINLPDCNGVELMKNLRAMEKQLRPDSQPIPMVAVSAHVFNEEVEEYLAAGFDAYLPKPINKQNLLDLVQACIEERDLLLPQMVQETSDTQSSVNLAVIEEDRLALGDEKICQLITLFDNSSHDILSQMEQAEQQADFLLVKQLAHKLKGSAGSMGMNELHQLCLEIESNSDPIAQYQQNRDKLFNVLEQSIRVVRKLFD